ATATLGTGTWSANVDTTKQANGSQTYTVYGWDVPAGQKAGNTVTKTVTASLSNVSPTLTPAPTPAPTPTPTPQVVSGLIRVPTPPAGSKITNIKIDGRRIKGTTFNTAYLTNGNHVMSYTLTDATGKATQITTPFIVSNNLNPFETIRNSLYSRFRH
ncbi:MAG: hypothetical protein AAB971_03980, partial [Patescibacteria group bacterium]